MKLPEYASKMYLLITLSAMVAMAYDGFDSRCYPDPHLDTGSLEKNTKWHQKMFAETDETDFKVHHQSAISPRNPSLSNIECRVDGLIPNRKAACRFDFEFIRV